MRPSSSFLFLIKCFRPHFASCVWHGSLSITHAALCAVILLLEANPRGLLAGQVEIIKDEGNPDSANAGTHEEVTVLWLRKASNRNRRERPKALPAENPVLS